MSAVSCCRYSHGARVAQLHFLPNIKQGFFQNRPRALVRVYADSQPGPTFRRIDQESTGGVDGQTQQAFGTKGMIAMGFDATQMDELLAYLEEAAAGADWAGPVATLGPPHVVVPRASLLEETLQEALGYLSQQAQAQMLPLLVAPLPQDIAPPMLIFSGLDSRSVSLVVEHLRAIAGLDEVIFAAAVPGNIGWQMGELCAEIGRDHVLLTQGISKEDQDSLEQLERVPQLPHSLWAQLLKVGKRAFGQK